MAEFVALKPCRFAGLDFKIGDRVPAELIQPGAAPALIKMGLIVDQNKEAVTAAPAITAPVNSKIEITVPVEEGRLALEVTKEEIQTIFDVLGSNVTEAEKLINSLTNGEALLLINLVDSRKSVQKAAEERAISLSEEANKEGEQ